MAMIMPSAHEVSPVLEELNHGGPGLAIGLEAIFKPGSPGASNGKRDSSCARSAQRARVGSSRASNFVSKSRSMRLALQGAPSSAWRKRDLRSGPSHGGNTSGSRAD